MWTQLIAGKTISAVNFAIHAVVTALIVLATRHTARVRTGRAITTERTASSSAR